MQHTGPGVRTALTIALAVVSASANAIQQRSFVSTSGNDANSCALAAPCRSFGAAIAQTSAGGEVVVLDSGGYGAFTITKSIAITSPPGVYAGISVLSPTIHGVDVNIGASDVVVLRGLAINNQFAGSSDGIHFASQGKLVVDGCTIAGFPNAGVNVPGVDAQLVVANSVLRDNGQGVHVGGLVAAAYATLEHNRYERNANSGVHVTDPSIVSITDSTFARGGIGILVEATNTFGSLVSITRNEVSGVTGIGVHLHPVSGTVDAALVGNVIFNNVGDGVNVQNAAGPGVSSNVTLAHNTINHNSGNGVVALNASARVTLDGNVITRNGATGIAVLSSATVLTRQNNTVKDNGSSEFSGALTPVVGL